MQLAELAARLVKADDAERRALLAENPVPAGLELARTLKDICLDGWSTHPDQALGAAASLRLLASQSPDPEIDALESWTRGLVALVRSHMETAISALDQSESQFRSVGKPHDAAATQVSKLVALAMRGRYDDAIACGLKARDELVSLGDLLNAGKIEHNIGNIYFRRDQYGEAEKFQRAARDRFMALNDISHLTKIENSLALTLSQQHRLGEAEALYEQALQRAETAGQLSTQAAIESSIGTMALYQGRYDRALDYLERSRRNYARLGMAHMSALTEQEIADAYLELNLIPEAAETYERLTNVFAELGMRAEEARALAYYARAEIALGRHDRAEVLLARAVKLFDDEKNEVGKAVVKLTAAQLAFAQDRYDQAVSAAISAEPALASAGAQRRLMFARWLHAEAARAAGSTSEALPILRRTLAETELDQPDLAARCWTSLGLAAQAEGDRGGAEQSFRRAATLIEQLRAPLPGEEFRTSFFADKLTPYQELMRLCLDEGRDAEAFQYSEMSRSRALADALSGEWSAVNCASDDSEGDLLRQIELARQQLNYVYRQEHSGRNQTQGTKSSLSADIRRVERELLELTRQLQHRRPYLAQATAVELASIQKQLGPDTTLIEYAKLDDQLLAFVVTAKNIKAVTNLALESQVSEEIAKFRFQIEALRFGSAAIRSHMPILVARARRHLASLYSQLWAPLRDTIGSTRVVISAHGTLHYLPFQALLDGENYLIENHEISYAPSASILRQTLERPRSSYRRALLVNVPDATIPHVNQEVEALHKIFPESFSLSNQNATGEALRRHSKNIDVLHLACHANFRSDNPLFSSLQLADGPFTVRDAYRLDLKGALVTLSACETGLNAIVPGDELIGLARGFFAAGAPSVLLSLWTVDDEATRKVMEKFYRQLIKGRSATESLRTAQMQLLKEKMHPFFWAPFVLIGHW